MYLKHSVRLDPETHKYYVPVPDPKGPEKNVPGYSEICMDLGISKPNPFWTDSGREEGQALHLWLGHLARGLKSKNAPDPRIAGRVKGIEKFLADTKFKIAGGELPCYDPINRYACTPDLFGFIGKTAWIIDAKRGSKLASHKLQTAAQTIALRANGFRAQKRASLYLRENDYRLEEHTDPMDLARWGIFVNCWHIRKEYA